jgi:hypothetical protein
LKELTDSSISAIKKAAKLLTGVKKRRYIAEISLEFLDGKPRETERVFGWWRETVKKALRELESGIQCMDNYSARGKKRIEDKCPQLREDIFALVEPQSQTDPDFKAPFRYTRITAPAVHKALIEEKGWTEATLPSVRSLQNILNRMGYRLRRVQKSKPQKKIPETDAIFENTHTRNQEADNNPECLRISMDVKAKVHIGELSRGGQARGASALQACDHDLEVKEKLTPVGIFEPVTGKSTIFLTTRLKPQT